MADCSHARCARYLSCRRGRPCERRYEASPKGRARNARYGLSPLGMAADGRYNLRRELRVVRARIASKTKQIEQLAEQLGLPRTEVPFHG